MSISEIQKYVNLRNTGKCQSQKYPEFNHILGYPMKSMAYFKLPNNIFTAKFFNFVNSFSNFYYN